MAEIDEELAQVESDLNSLAREADGLGLELPWIKELKSREAAEERNVGTFVG